MTKTAEEIVAFSDIASLQKCILAYCTHSLSFYYSFSELEPTGKKLCLTFRRFLADLEHRTTVGYYEYALIPANTLGLTGTQFVACLYFMGILKECGDIAKYYDSILNDLLSYGVDVFAIATNEDNERFLKDIFDERINIIKFM